MTATLSDAALLAAVESLRGAVAATALPLDLPGVEQSRRERATLLAQLDDYVLPRLQSLEAPLLCVVGGSTGAGKSTLVNSLVGEVVSRSGVLRPTTRASVLVHHPEDAHWFLSQRTLPGLARLTGAPGGADQPGPGPAAPAAGQGADGRDAASGGRPEERAPKDDPSSVRLVASDFLAPGLALLDAPDIDSVVTENRNLAHQLLQAADLWLFVTTAARYADAVPWDLLRQASERGTSVAVVLDRVAPDQVDEIRTDLAFMLREQGLGSAPVFTVVETGELHPDGRLPESQVSKLRSWLSALAQDAKARSIIVRRTLTGAISALPPRVELVADGVRGQVAAGTALRVVVTEKYQGALAEVESGMQDGSLLRGEVLARWQELVGTNEFLRSVEASVSRLRDRVTAWIKGDPPPAEDLGEALQTGTAQLIVAHAATAHSDTVRRWRELPGGSYLLGRRPDLLRPARDLDPRVERLVRDWQSDVFDLVRDEGGRRRNTARFLAFGVNGLGVMLMILVFSATGGLTGAEVGIAGGSSVLAQRLLEAVFGDQAVRELAERARQLLLDRSAELFATEQARFVSAVDDMAPDPRQVDALTGALTGIRSQA